jgi:hypothetical protein
LPVLEHFTGKLALAHATLAGFCHLYGDAPGIDSLSSEA